MNISAKFNSYRQDYTKFNLIKNKRATHPEEHALIILSELMLTAVTLTASGDSEEVFLDIPGDIILSLQEDMITELVRCGVKYNEDNRCLTLPAHSA
jgi:hypothetical protein